MQKVTIGSIEMVALIDMVAAYPAKNVYPKVADFSDFERYLDSDGSVALNFASFLVRDGSTLLLVDTGWGRNTAANSSRNSPSAGSEAGRGHARALHPPPRRPHGLEYRPRIWRTDSSRNARHFVPKADWDHYQAEAVEARKTTNKPWLGSFDRDMVPLMDRGLVDLISGETTVSASLTAIPTPGHTPGHTSVVHLRTANAASCSAML